MGEKIKQIVRLKQLMHRWKNMSLVNNNTATNKSSGGRVPSGFLAVYVEHHRFLIPTRYLKLAVFVTLLNKAEEEFGYQSKGGLVLPCDLHFFKQVLCFLERDESRFGNLGFDEFSNLISPNLAQSSCSKQQHQSTPARRHHKTNHAGYTLLFAES